VRRNTDNKTYAPVPVFQPFFFFFFPSYFLSPAKASLNQLVLGHLNTEKEGGEKREERREKKEERGERGEREKREERRKSRGELSRAKEERKTKR